MIRLTIVLLALLLPPAGTAAGQVLIRVGDASRATYSEIHEGLQPGTRAADSALAVLREKRPAVLWRRIRAALRGDAAWNDAPLALTRLAELRDRGYADSAARLDRAIAAGEVDGPPGQDPADLQAPLRAVALERGRAARGDTAVLKELLALIPLLARVYAAPDSFGVPPRYATRASDALLWIGTRSSLAALLDARRRARERGVYAARELSRGGYDFLANDSSAVISRTGKWLTEWIREPGPGT